MRGLVCVDCAHLQEKYVHIQRVNLKDYVAVHRTAFPESKAVRFHTSTADLADLNWAPNSEYIAVWDSPLTFHVLVYRIDGACLASYQAELAPMGVRSVAWGPTGQLLAIAAYDQSVHVLNHVTWKRSAQFKSLAAVKDERVVIFEEVGDSMAKPNSGQENNADELNSMKSQRRYVVRDPPFEVPMVKCAVNKAYPAIGVHILKFSASGIFLACKNENMPRVLWIWDIRGMMLACILVQEEVIVHFEWDPQDEKLAVCTGDKRIYLWKPDGSSCVHCPLSKFDIQHLQWRKDGKAMVMCDRDRFCISYMV